jgi:site-specific DNA recombinase
MHALRDEIMRLYDEGLTLKAIAARVGYSRELVRRSLDLWFDSRGLARPDGRTRRKDLARRPGSRRADAATPPPGRATGT